VGVVVGLRWDFLLWIYAMAIHIYTYLSSDRSVITEVTTELRAELMKPVR
jgi:hypothetical protein